MIKISFITFFGFLVAAVAIYDGFPPLWEKILYFILGVAIIILSVLIRRELHKVIKFLHSEEVTSTDTYSESRKTDDISGQVLE